MTFFARDSKTGLEIGINDNGELFCGDKKSGFNMIDNNSNRRFIASYFRNETKLTVNVPMIKGDE